MTRSALACRRLIAAVGLVLALFAPGLWAGFDFESLEALPPGEQYRQLSLLSLVSGGADAAQLADFEDRQAPGSELTLDDFATPLARIVDQEMLLAGAADALRFARENGPAIQRRMTEIARANPVLISMVDVNALAADAIIIRTAIADSLEYAGDSADSARLQDFRRQTVHLRNMMEYNQFQEELAVITEQAIVDLGGRLDAYQRMFEDEIDPERISRRIQSAELMNQQTDDRYEEQALERNAELLMMLIMMESQVE